MKTKRIFLRTTVEVKFRFLMEIGPEKTERFRRSTGGFRRAVSREPFRCNVNGCFSKSKTHQTRTVSDVSDVFVSRKQTQCIIGRLQPLRSTSGVRTKRGTQRVRKPFKDIMRIVSYRKRVEKRVVR